jgi:hypothetical protein
MDGTNGYQRMAASMIHVTNPTPPTPRSGVPTPASKEGGRRDSGRGGAQGCLLLMGIKTRVGGEAGV